MQIIEGKKEKKKERKKERKKESAIIRFTSICIPSNGKKHIIIQIILSLNDCCMHICPNTNNRKRNWQINAITDKRDLDQETCFCEQSSCLKNRKKKSNLYTFQNTCYITT